MPNKNIKIAVVGGGHAGIEAALAISRMGKQCYMITMDTDSIGRMSCNPAIGGLAKGHLVREIDALGGIMGRAADLTAIQFKTLNKSKGRAVWSPRAQVDKIKYSEFVRSAVLNDLNISIINDEVVDIVVDKLSVAIGAWRSLVSALVWGTRGWRFESIHPDQLYMGGHSISAGARLLG